MKHFRIGLFAISLLVAATASAHRVALKNGTVIEFDNYRTTERLLLYTDQSGTEVKLPLDDIDYERTQDLNASDSQPVALPGLAIPGFDIGKQQCGQPSEDAR